MQMILWVILVLTNIITSPKQHSTTNETAGNMSSPVSKMQRVNPKSCAQASNALKIL